MDKRKNYNLVLKAEGIETAASKLRGLHENEIKRLNKDIAIENRLYVKGMREIFTEYVILFCPDYVDKIDWVYFEILKSMSDNLEIQKNVWKELSNI